MLFLYQQQIKELKQDLKSFGLNPQDWKLVQESRRLYRIKSTHDSSFTFIGSRSPKRNRWDKIEIASL